MVFTEMSITSALCSTGSTTAPVKVTSTLRTLETISALPCSTLRNRRLTMNSTPMHDEQDDGEEYAEAGGDDIHVIPLGLRLGAVGGLAGTRRTA